MLFQNDNKISNNDTVNTMTIWKILTESNYVDEVYNETNKLFAIKIYEDDLNHLKNNYHKIINPDIHYECFMIACSFSNDVNIVQFIVDKFRIDPNFINKYTNNGLYNIHIIGILYNSLSINLG
jgi:hypothetical protein